MSANEFADELGVGLGFQTNWDFEVRGGSMGLIGGLDLLGRDLAFALQQHLGDERGQFRSSTTRGEVYTATNRVVTEDSRVEELTDLSVTFPDDTNGKVEVEMEIVAETGERGEFIIGN